MRITKSQLTKLIKETLAEQGTDSSIEDIWNHLMDMFRSSNQMGDILNQPKYKTNKALNKVNRNRVQAVRYLEKSWEILKAIRGENKEALKEQTYSETGEPKQQFQELISDIDRAVGSLLFFGRRNSNNGIGWKAVRLSKELRKIIDTVALTESLSTRRALEDQEIEDSSVIDIEEPISKAEEDWEAEQNRLAGDDEEGLWALKMREKYGPDWEEILQQDAINKM